MVTRNFCLCTQCSLEVPIFFVVLFAIKMIHDNLENYIYSISKWGFSSEAILYDIGEKRKKIRIGKVVPVMLKFHFVIGRPIWKLLNDFMLAWLKDEINMQ